MISRRGFLSIGAGAAGVATVGVGVGLTTSRPGASFSLANYSSADLLGNDPALHLVRRATFGPTTELLADVRAAGPSAWLDRQLAVTSANADPLKAQLVGALPKLGWSPTKLNDERNSGSRDVLNDIIKGTAARAAWSPNQLHEVMASFWSNHFNVYVKNGNGFQFRVDYDDAMRAGALTSFSQLLQTVITHPAMLIYLNANTSTKTNPNENLGRELLELHTLGVGNYTEADVKNSALMLTGLGTRNNAFFYNPATHFTGTLTITSFTHENKTAADGQAAITAYLNFLARSPLTAAHIATELATRFVSDTPPDSLIATLTDVYLANDTRIAPVLRALFTSSEFAHSSGQKYRAPFDDAMATLRVLGHRMPSTDAQWNALNKVVTSSAQVPLSWPTPDGYPNVITPWLSPASTLARMNTHYDLAAGKQFQSNFPGIKAVLPATLPATWAAAVDALAARILFTPIAIDHSRAILTMLGKKDSDPVTSAELESLAASTIVPALLNSPYQWMC
jgi:uncharacterized protein (DUF1800 family)